MSKYNYDTDDFENFPLARTAGEWNISSMVEDENGSIWASSTGGDIFLRSKTDNKFKQLNIDVRAYGVKHISFINIWKKAVIVGTELGLFKVSANKTTLEHIELGLKRPEINCAYVDKETLWIGTEGAGLITLANVTGEIKNYRHTSGQNTLADNNIQKQQLFKFIIIRYRNPLR
ncbi:Two component regulator propeller [compost metagenome]